MRNEDINLFLLNFTITGVTAIASKSVVAPLERIKLILQNQDSALQIMTQEREKYKGVIDCLIRLPKEQGFSSLWRGNGVMVLRYVPTQALNFAYNDFYKGLLCNSVEDDRRKSIAGRKFLAGMLAGASTCAILYPLEFCQTRLAVDIGTDTLKGVKAKIPREFNSLTHCVRKVHRIDGVRGLYSGFPVACFGISLYRSLYFGLFDVVKNLWGNKSIYAQGTVPPKPPLLLSLCFAQLVTCGSGFLVYPLDTIGRRLMLLSGRPEALKQYHGSWGATKFIYRKHGIIGFYKGCVPNCLRGVSGAMVLVFYDEVLHYTNWKSWITLKDGQPSK